MDYSDIIDSLEGVKEQLKNAKDQLAGLVGQHRTVKYACDDIDDALTDVQTIIFSICD